jgi:hypothetical protein
VNMGEAAFAFELSKVVNGVLFAGSEHSVTVNGEGVGGKGEMCRVK